MKIKIISNSRFRRAIFVENGKVEIKDFPPDATRTQIENALRPPIVSYPVTEDAPDSRKELIARAATMNIKTPGRLSTKNLAKKISQAEK